ncbi:MAG: hypothetical protein D6731_16510 [Planctomycetota bacterium]|nr:MAG: hypothetical protein D6731_16510 [Planctomycetota bacterium]
MSSADPDYEEGLPRVRLELGVTSYAFLVARTKAGRQGVATAFDPFVEGGLPGGPTAALSAYLDVKLWSWASLGGMYWGLHQAGGAHHIDSRGIGLHDTIFPGGLRVRAQVALQHAELSLRYVWFHTRRVHLWFGIGPSWFSFRVALRPPGAPGASRRIEAFFAPALTYSIAARIPGADSLRIHLSSSIAVSYAQWPSFVAWSRFGLRYAVTPGIELTCALNARNGIIAREKGITRYPVTSGYRHRRVRWSAVGLEVGVAFSY